MNLEFGIKEDKQNSELLGVLEFEVSDIIVETNKMILIQISEGKQVWIPISNLWLNKVKNNTFKLPVYVLDNRVIRLIVRENKENKEGDVKLLDLYNWIAKGNELFNCKVVNKKHLK